MQVASTDVATVKASFERAPWGYCLPTKQMQDWRSWEAYYCGRHCLQAIELQQSFPDRMPCALVDPFL